MPTDQDQAPPAPAPGWVMPARRRWTISGTIGALIALVSIWHVHRLPTMVDPDYLSLAKDTYDAAKAFRSAHQRYPADLAELAEYVFPPAAEQGNNPKMRELRHRLQDRPTMLATMAYRLTPAGPVVTHFGRDRKPGGNHFGSDATFPLQYEPWSELITIQRNLELVIAACIFGVLFAWAGQQFLAISSGHRDTPSWGWITTQVLCFAFVTTLSVMVISIIMSFHVPSGH